MEAVNLSDFLKYDPDTGMFFWKIRTASDLGWSESATERWNNKYSGRIALNTKTSFGHRYGQILGVSVLAHRAAIAISTGAWPSGDVDHINGVPSDNRLCNLRVVSKSTNQKNRKKNANNTSGYPGVYWKKNDRKWRAAYRDKGKEYHVGYFNDPEEASAARRAAIAGLDFTDRHGS